MTKSKVLIFTYILCFCCLNPALLDNFYVSIPNLFWFLLMFIVCVIVSLDYKSDIHTKIPSLLLYIFPSYHLIISTFRLDFDGVQSAVEIFVFSFIIIQILSFIGLERFRRLTIQILLVISLASTLIFLAVLLFGLQPAGEATVFEGFKTLWNFRLAVSPVYYSIGSLSFIRTGGIFDEPGRLSFLLIMTIILIDVANLGDKNQAVRRWFIISNFATTSLIGFFTGLLLIRVRINTKYLFYALFVTCTFVAIFVSTSAWDSINEVFSRLIFDRLQFDSESGFSGNNRYSSMIGGLDLVVSNPFIGVGEYAINTLYREYDRSSLFGIFAMYGIFGGLTYFAPIYYILYHLIRGRYFIHSIILLLLLLQRPYIYSFHFLTLIIILLLTCHSRKLKD